MKIKPYIFVTTLAIILSSCGGSNQSQEETQQASTNSSSEWITLFDGESFDGWKVFKKDSITSESGWTIVDGALACNAGIGEENVGFSNTSLMTTDEFGNFELELEYKIAKGGNSGIFYHVKEEGYGFDFATGPEYQVLDDANSRSENEPFKMAASNYAMHAPADNKQVNDYMEWNKVKIVYNNGHVEHWLNGDKVLAFEEGSAEWKAIKATSKWAETDSYASHKEGAFSLQNHGDEVYFRNIRVREL